MKKLFLALVAVSLALVSCKKEQMPDYQLEGLQWITEEISSEDGDHRLIYDIGRTEPGQFYTMKLYTEDSASHKAGELEASESNKNPYTYDAKKGILTVNGFITLSMTVKFLDEKNIILNLLGETQAFSVSKQYYDPTVTTPVEPVAFAISSDKDADWAGGTINFTANEDVETWSCQLANKEDQTLIPQLESSISANGELTLGSYFKRLVANVKAFKNVEIKVTATSVSGKTATYVVTSKGWELTVVAEDVASQLAFASKDSIQFGPKDADNAWVADFFTNKNWSWIHNCLFPYANGDGVFADIMTKQQILDASYIKDKEAPYYIKLTYGKLTQTYADITIF